VSALQFVSLYLADSPIDVKNQIDRKKNQMANTTGRTTISATTADAVCWGPQCASWGPQSPSNFVRSDCFFLFEEGKFFSQDSILFYEKLAKLITNNMYV
jgi:hypothetical protein